ncbi:MAG: protein kinase [Paludisphaera borealis]|uniref:protein kinase domain-containing protein n=1 Tax=Paludisphaera borealis TaxID=1387353 RepID=UPI00283FDFE2|nr:protein kinase [Paludisphaera borealis]MDR3620743.1 protein kinase [Paludisphaera borealis]
MISEIVEDDVSSSEFRDLQACLGLLDHVWPRSKPAPDRDGGPDQLGRFRILSELGRGGFGIVFLAEDPILGRKVALKVPRVEVLSHGESWARFLREAKAASRLDHPNLVPLLETGEIGPVRYIASVYVEGPSLDVWLARRGEPVHPRFAARLVMVLARAIDHVHQRGILHLDLKPGNVLLQDADRDGEAPAEADLSGRTSLPFVPRICDFGLSRLLDAEGDDSRTVVAAGSPSYMAPEQAEGRREGISRATDVYGLGAILYELLAGRPPFRGKSSLDTIRKVVTEDPPPPRRARPNVPRDLETICLESLAKQPLRRYASAGALADDLECFLENRPIQARPASIWDRAWKWSCRRPAAAAFIVLAAVGLALGFAGLNRYNAALSAKNKELGEALVQAKNSEESALAQKQLADDRERQTRRHMATSQVRQAQQAVDAEQLELADRLLDASALELGPPGARGFAWDYLSRRVNDELQVLKGHQASVEFLAASPDGRTLASGDDPGEIRLWDLSAGTCRVIASGLGGRVIGLAFSPDGRTLASSRRGFTGRVALWDVATGKLKRRLAGARGTCHRIWFSVDGFTLSAIQEAPLNDPRRRLCWDVETGDSRPVAADAAREGLRLKAVVDLLEARPAATVATSEESGFETTGRGEPGLAFTSDGRFAVIGLDDGTFEVVASRENLRLAIGRLERGRVREVLFLLSKNPEIDQVVDRILEALEPVKASLGLDVERTAAISPLNHDAVYAPGVGQLARWGSLRPSPFLIDSAGKRERAAYHFGLPVPVTAMTYLPDGATLAFGAVDRRIRLWRWNRPVEPPPLVGHAPKEAWSVAYSPDGRILATSGDDHEIRLWDPDSGVPRGTLRGHRSLVGTIAWAPDGETLASGSHDKTVRLWDVRAGKARTILSGHTGFIRAVAFSPDGRILASAGDDRTIRLWNPRTGLSIAVLSGHGDAVWPLAFSPDGGTMASASLDGRIDFWDVATLRSRGFAAGPSVIGMAFSPDGATLAAAYVSEPTQLWDVASGKPRATLLGHHSDVNSIAFSPDGRSLATGGIDRSVRIWDCVEGVEMLNLVGHEARVNGVAFRPDGRTLASVDHVGAIRFWRASRP